MAIFSPALWRLSAGRLSDKTVPEFSAVWAYTHIVIHKSAEPITQGAWRLRSRDDLIETTPDCFSAGFPIALSAKEAPDLRDETHDLVQGTSLYTTPAAITKRLEFPFIFNELASTL